MDENQNGQGGIPEDFLKRGVARIGNFRFAATVTSHFLVIFSVVISFLVVFTLAIVLENTGKASEGNQNQNQVLQQPATQPVQSNDIPYWASQLSSNLRTFDTSCSSGVYLYNVMTFAATNGSYTIHTRTGSACGLASTTYFCTDFVIDSYNLAGINMPNLEYAGDMFNWWRNQSGLSIKEENDVTGLSSGDVIFWVDPNETRYYLKWKHVGIIKQIGLNDKGQLTLTTMDANLNHRINDFPIINNQVRGTFVDDSGNPIGWKPEFGLGPRK